MRQWLNFPRLGHEQIESQPTKGWRPFELNLDLPTWQIEGTDQKTESRMCCH